MRDAPYLRKSRSGQAFDFCNVIILLLLFFVTVYPFYQQLIISLNEGIDADRATLYFFPRKFTLENYEWLFQHSGIPRGLLISLLRVVVGTSTGLFCTAMLAYLVSVRHFAGRRPLRIFFLITMYFGGGFIPTYLLYIRLGLLNTFHVYWIPYLFNAYYMLIIASYIQNLPYSLVESALMDGAGYTKIFTRIIVPMSIPVLAAIAVFMAVNQWNAWFDNMIYNASGKWDTVQIILKRMMLEADIDRKLTLETQAAQRMHTRTATTVKAACTMVITIPIIMVYPFFQRYFISGITLGAVKE